jgi:hypothetical protein
VLLQASPSGSRDIATNIISPSRRPWASNPVFRAAVSETVETGPILPSDALFISVLRSPLLIITCCFEFLIFY